MLTPQQRSFLATAAAAAVASEKATGFPAEISLSQAVFESGWGQHAPGNNYFGIKQDDHGSGVQYKISQEFLNGSWVTRREAFETYSSADECFEDHARLITQGAPYQEVWRAYQGGGGLDQLIDGICLIYATDPGYTAKILGEAHSQTVVQVLLGARAAIAAAPVDPQTQTPIS